MLEIWRAMFPLDTYGYASVIEDFKSDRIFKAKRQPDRAVLNHCTVMMLGHNQIHPGQDVRKKFTT